MDADENTELQNSKVYWVDLSLKCIAFINCFKSIWLGIRNTQVSAGLNKCITAWINKDMEQKQV